MHTSPREWTPGRCRAARRPRKFTGREVEFRDGAEREFVIGALKRNNGNVSQSALELGVRRTYLHRRMAVLKINKKDYFV